MALLARAVTSFVVSSPIFIKQHLLPLTLFCQEKPAAFCWFGHRSTRLLCVDFATHSVIQTQRIVADVYLPQLLLLSEPVRINRNHNIFTSPLQVQTCEKLVAFTKQCAPQGLSLKIYKTISINIIRCDVYGIDTDSKTRVTVFNETYVTMKR